jgi:hypothetical protein
MRDLTVAAMPVVVLLGLAPCTRLLLMQDSQPSRAEDRSREEAHGAAAAAGGGKASG